MAVNDDADAWPNILEYFLTTSFLCFSLGLLAALLSKLAVS